MAASPANDGVQSEQRILAAIGKIKDIAKNSIALRLGVSTDLGVNGSAEVLRVARIRWAQPTVKHR